MALEFKAGLPEDFFGKNDDVTRWLLAMKAYFGMNNHLYKDDKTVMLVFLNKMSKERGATFTEGWYLKLINEEILDADKNFKKLCAAFKETFIPKDIKDRARQIVYSLNMEQFKNNFDKYITAFKLAQAHCGVDDNSILVDALQRGVTNQLATMMMAATLPPGQEKTGWKWEQWIDKAGEFYRNIVQLKRLRTGRNSSIPASSSSRGPCHNPYTMNVDKIHLSPQE